MAIDCLHCQDTRTQPELRFAFARGIPGMFTIDTGRLRPCSWCRGEDKIRGVVYGEWDEATGQGL